MSRKKELNYWSLPYNSGSIYLPRKNRNNNDCRKQNNRKFEMQQEMQLKITYNLKGKSKNNRRSKMKIEAE